jgi:hypothetical protein
LQTDNSFTKAAKAAKAEDSEEAKVSKAVTAILNRLAPQNFNKLSKEMVDLEVKSRTVLEAVRAPLPLPPLPSTQPLPPSPLHPALASLLPPLA